MNVTGFIWLEDILDKLWSKHHIEQDEIIEAFGNAPHFRFVEKGHREGEHVYAALSRTDSGRYVVIFFVHKRDARALVLSARDMTDTERRKYERR